MRFRRERKLVLSTWPKRESVEYWSAMATSRSLVALFALGALVGTTALTSAGCGSDDAEGSDLGGGDDAGADAADEAAVDAGADAGGDAPSDAVADAPGEATADAAPSGSRIEHVVVVVQENHTFDNYFGSYCTAPAGSNPSCTTGPACCEAAPEKEPSGASPVALDDAQNAKLDPNHFQSCEVAELHGGAMDRFVTGGPAGCSNAGNFAISPASAVGVYRGLASTYAMADRYFQSIAGASSANDMYFAEARFVFTDNTAKPDAIGRGCLLGAGAGVSYSRTTVADLLVDAGKSFAFYAQGYAAMKSAPLCPAAPGDCPLHLPTYPCTYDPSDNPFEYYPRFRDDPTYERDWDDFAKDVAGGTLPNVAFLKGAGYRSEHPGYGTTISAGMNQVQSVVDAILGSPYAATTLVLVAWDEGGGYFDHVPPPADSAVDGKPFGTRVPFLVVGAFARQNYVSHVPLDHASVVKFLEWNFLGATGQLGARDAVSNNLGDLLDPAAVGVEVPAN